eukprot:scaffold6874_cov31-Attheya_sp.AAC.2
MPADKMDVTKFLEKLSVSSEKKARIKENPRSHNVAPWHISPDHTRKQDEIGKWCFRLRDGGVYFNGDRKKYPFPPPNYNHSQRLYYINSIGEVWN